MFGFSGFRCFFFHPSMSPGAAAAVTVPSVETKFPICIMLSRNPFSGRNAVGRANRRRGCWRFSRSVAPKLLASAYTLPAGFLTVLSLLQLSPSHGCTSPTWVLQLFAHVMHEPMHLATLRRASTRVRRWGPTYNGPGAKGRKPLPKKKNLSWPPRCGESQHPRICFTRRSFRRRKSSRFLTVPHRMPRYRA